MKRPMRASALTLLALLEVIVVAGCGGADTTSDSESPQIGKKSAASTMARFGTYCQENYQSGWQVSLSYMNERCNYFNDELDDTDYEAFYFNLSGKKYYLEQYGDHQADLKAPDDVDLLYMGTHGGAQTYSSIYAMYDVNQFAYTSNMRLGDSAWWGGGLAILATYSCQTLKVSDGGLVTRWGSVLRGGLKMAVGSHDTLWDGLTTDETGEDFADDLQHGYSIEYSWYDGNTDWYFDQDTAVVATGTNSTNCSSRKDQMTWQSYGNYPFLRDANIGWTCWTYWNDT